MGGGCQVQKGCSTLSCSIYHSTIADRYAGKYYWPFFPPASGLSSSQSFPSFLPSRLSRPTIYLIAAYSQLTCNWVILTDALMKPKKDWFIQKWGILPRKNTKKTELKKSEFWWWIWWNCEAKCFGGLLFLCLFSQLRGYFLDQNYYCRINWSM